MLVVTEQEVRRLIDAKSALAIARDTLIDQAGGGSYLSCPSAMTLDSQALGGPQFKFKAATVGHLAASGIRLLARMGNATDDNACNFVAIYDHAQNGILLGMVSELWLSRIRTAAFGVAAVEPLLPARSLSVGLFGAGKIADEIVGLLDLALNVRELKVLSRRPERTTSFVERHRPTLGGKIKVAHSAEHAVAGSDLVITLTESQEPLVQPGWLGRGAVLCSMGSHNEMDFNVLAEAERLIVDDPGYASEMGDGGAWIRAGHMTREDFHKRIDGLACRYAADFRQGHRSDGRTTIALIQGMAIGDIAFAVYAIRKLQPRQARSA